MRRVARQRGDDVGLREPIKDGLSSHCHTDGETSRTPERRPEGSATEAGSGYLSRDIIHPPDALDVEAGADDSRSLPVGAEPLLGGDTQM